MAAVRAGWARFRSWPRWVQVVLVVAALAAIGAAGGGDDPATELEATRSSDIADSLPMATTTSTTSELGQPTTTTTTTTSAAPTPQTPPTTTTTTTAPPPPPPTTTTAPPPPAPQAFAAPSGCHPSYDPCVPVASDVDCAGGSGNGPEHTGRVSVIGPDEYDLDRDGDGVGCE